MIIDGHAHVTEADYGSPDRLSAQMAEAGITQAVLVPGGMIDVRRMTRYLTGQEPVPEGAIPNGVVERLVAQNPGRFFGFYCVNPHDGDRAVEAFRDAIGRGFRGLKLAPLVHRFALTSETVRDLAEACGALGVPFYTHVTYSPGAATDKIGFLAREFPATTFILGHMGFGPADIDAVELALRYDNLYLETSGGSFLVLKLAFERLGAGKLVFGSEFPLYHPRAELEKIRLLADGEAFERIIGTNLLTLLGESVRWTR
ncbi:MAG: amidohydrolase family protein [Candidatus Methylomirabilia bacterium]